MTSGEYSHVIVAIGIQPNTENIGIEKLAELDRGFIQIDGYGRTKTKGIWAIGDCVPGPWLAHKASHEGVTAAEAIAQELGNKEVHPHPLDRNNIPGCTYCHPQIASVGMTEAKAKEAGHTVKVGNFPFIGNGKAIALGEAEGFVKTVFDAKTGELLGAHMIGAEVTETHPGLCRGQDARDHRGGTDEHDLPASDHQRDDARKRARSLWPGAAYLSGMTRAGTAQMLGGQGGIRTHEELAPLPVFKTGAFNRSATCPQSRRRLQRRKPFVTPRLCRAVILAPAKARRSGLTMLPRRAGQLDRGFSGLAQYDRMMR